MSWMLYADENFGGGISSFMIYKAYFRTWVFQWKVEIVLCSHIWKMESPCNHLEAFLSHRARFHSKPFSSTFFRRRWMWSFVVRFVRIFERYAAKPSQYRLKSSIHFNIGNRSLLIVLLADSAGNCNIFGFSAPLRRQQPYLLLEILTRNKLWTFTCSGMWRRRRWRL